MNDNDNFQWQSLRFGMAREIATQGCSKTTNTPDFEKKIPHKIYLSNMKSPNCSKVAENLKIDKISKNENFNIEIKSRLVTLNVNRI